MNEHPYRWRFQNSIDSREKKIGEQKSREKCYNTYQLFKIAYRPAKLLQFGLRTLANDLFFFFLYNTVPLMLSSQESDWSHIDTNCNIFIILPPSHIFRLSQKGEGHERESSPSFQQAFYSGFLLDLLRAGISMGNLAWQMDDLTGQPLKYTKEKKIQLTETLLKAYICI